MLLSTADTRKLHRIPASKLTNNRQAVLAIAAIGLSISANRSIAHKPCPYQAESQYCRNFHDDDAFDLASLAFCAVAGAVLLIDAAVGVTVVLTHRLTWLVPLVADAVAAVFSVAGGSVSSTGVR